MSPMTLAADLPEVHSLPVEPKRLLDVPGALERVHAFGEYIAVRAGAAEMDRMLFTTMPENTNGTENHFQGFQRLHDGRHFVISGGNWHADPRGSELYIGRLDSTPGNGPWSSNLTHTAKAPEADRIVRGITVDPKLWHSGGMDVCGPVLAIAVEHNGNPTQKLLLGAGRGGLKAESAIYFFDMSDPENPRRFSHRIHREGAKAGAVALTRLASGHYLCGVWSDSDKPPLAMRLDLYVSRNGNVFDGDFLQDPGAVRSWVPDKDDPARRAFKFQAISFVRDTDGHLYLLGLGRDVKAHAVEIYKVHIPGVHAPPTGGIMEPIFERLIDHRRTFECDIKQCDMRGASGVYVDNELIVYSGSQYRGSNAGDPVRFAEYRGPLSPVPDVNLNTAWVELYAEPQHQGPRLTLRNLSLTGSVPNYKKIQVNGENFGDKAHSARYQLPLGLDYVLFEDHEFAKPIIRLRGTGQVEVEPDFEVLADKVSSSRVEHPNV